MREIKFRGKRIDNEEWVYGFLIKTKENNIFILVTPVFELPFTTHNGEAGVAIGSKYFQVDPKTVGQLLAVMNGQEIYEGDIVKADYGLGHPPQKVDMETFYWYYGEGMISESSIKVIGNIYDNPDLLEGQS